MNLEQAVREAIGQEIGRDIKITDYKTDFSVLGIDGLAAISVVESVSTRTGVDLPASLFRDCTNLSELAGALGQQTVIPYGKWMRFFARV